MHLPYQCGFKGRNAVNANLFLNLIKNNFLIFFFNRESSQFESLLTPKSENFRLHSSNSIENFITVTLVVKMRLHPAADSSLLYPPPPPGVFRTRSWWRNVVKVARSEVCVTLSEISVQGNTVLGTGAYMI